MREKTEDTGVNGDEGMKKEGWLCPLCGTYHSERLGVCESCGYDRSADCSRFPTLVPIEVKTTEKEERFTVAGLDGTVITGIRKGKEIVGPLVQRDSRGNVFTCRWKDGNWNGQGKYAYADGSVLTGRWERGKVAGDGRIAYLNGTVYEGEIENFLPQGNGSIRFPGGAVLNGSFLAGGPVGDVDISFPSGGSYRGCWNKGLNGKGVFMHLFCPDIFGIIYSGNWVNSLPFDNDAALTVYDSSPGDGYEYCGGIKQGNLSGSGRIYTVKNGLKSFLADDFWMESKRCNSMKSPETEKQIRKAEKMLQKALAYIEKTVRLAV